MLAQLMQGRFGRGICVCLVRRNTQPFHRANLRQEIGQSPYASEERRVLWLTLMIRAGSRYASPDLPPCSAAARRSGRQSWVKLKTLCTFSVSSLLKAASCASCQCRVTHSQSHENIQGTHQCHRPKQRLRCSRGRARFSP